MPPTTFTVSAREPARLRSAVRTLFDAPRTPGSPALPSASRLHAIAEETVRTGEGDAARFFTSLLELGYLVASADGLAEEERTALAELLEQITGRGIDQAAMRLHFEDLDATCKALGRHERLRRAAADFEDRAAREEALDFAALVALADGEISEVEVAALVELGNAFEMKEDEVTKAIGALVAAVEHQVGTGGAR
jgi:tellurite resistance protein